MYPSSRQHYTGAVASSSISSVSGSYLSSSSRNNMLMTSRQKSIANRVDRLVKHQRYTDALVLLDVLLRSLLQQQKASSQHKEMPTGNSLGAAAPADDNADAQAHHLDDNSSGSHSMNNNDLLAETLTREEKMNVRAHYSMLQVRAHVELQQPDAALRLLQTQTATTSPTSTSETATTSTVANNSNSNNIVVSSSSSSSSCPFFAPPPPSVALTTQCYNSAAVSSQVVAIAAKAKATKTEKKLQRRCLQVEEERATLAASRVRLLIRTTFALHQWRRCLEYCEEALQLSAVLQQHAAQRRALIQQFRQQHAEKTSKQGDQIQKQKKQGDVDNEPEEGNVDDEKNFDDDDDTDSDSDDSGDDSDSDDLDQYDLLVEAHVTAARVHVVATGNGQQASVHYQSALQHDPFSAVAFKGIVDNWLLPPKDQALLVESLVFKSQQQQQIMDPSTSKKLNKKQKPHRRIPQSVEQSYYSAILARTPMDADVLGIRPKFDGEEEEEKDDDALDTDPIGSNAVDDAISSSGAETSPSSLEDDVESIKNNKTKKKKKKTRREHNNNKKLLVSSSSGSIGSRDQLPLYLRRYRQALMSFHDNDLPRANACLTQGLREGQVLHEPSVCLRLAVLVDQRATSELFDFAHSVADEARNTALAAYSIGCFYFSIANFDQAGRFFCRATEIEPMFAPGWIAYGHCYSRLEETECALSAYRRAQALFPGLLDAKLFLGMQYSRSQNFPLARCFLWEAYEAAPHVPLVLNELGVLAFRNGQYEEAYQYLMEARSAQYRTSKDSPNEYEDCIIFNLATLLRKMRQYEEAAELYTLYTRLRPYALCAHTALGFTKHLMGDLKGSIGHYHTALSLKPDGFTRDLLERALSEEYSHDVGGEKWNPAGVGAASLNSGAGGGGGGGGNSGGAAAASPGLYLKPGGAGGGAGGGGHPHPHASAFNQQQQQQQRGGYGHSHGTWSGLSSTQTQHTTASSTSSLHPQQHHQQHNNTTAMMMMSSVSSTATVSTTAATASSHASHHHHHHNHHHHQHHVAATAAQSDAFTSRGGSEALALSTLSAGVASPRPETNRTLTF